MGLKFSLISVFLIGCASGNCRTQPDYKSKAKVDEQATLKTQTETQLSKVKVYQPDGSLQCGQGKAISINEAKKKLGNIKVYFQETTTDGLMRMQVCGAPTGQIHVFEIDRSDLASAKKSGFLELEN